MVERAYDFFKTYKQPKTGRNLSPGTLREYLELITACWDWASTKGYVDCNPWTELVARVKVPPTQPPRPFSLEEVLAIVQAFRTDKYYSYYSDMVEFMLSTGCRVGEAIGLRWGHLEEDCSSVWIGESYSRGQQKATKTNRARTVTLNPKMQSLLLARRPAKPKPEDIVFTAAEGKNINDNNFRIRAWQSVLTRLGIDYRPPYNTRHTLISHSLDLRSNPVMIAQQTGHDVKVLFSRYSGVVGDDRLPDYMNTGGT